MPEKVTIEKQYASIRIFAIQTLNMHHKFFSLYLLYTIVYVWEKDIRLPGPAFLKQFVKNGGALLAT